MARVTDAQVKVLRRHLHGGTSLQLAALKTGMDRHSARKYRQGQLPSERAQPHTWRTRPDPLAAVWAELEIELQRAPGLQANTLLALLEQRYPGQYGPGVLRTLQRRLKRWRALAGPAKEVFFAQKHEPGRLAASDFTHMSSLGITIAGQAFPHMVYHFVLTYSNWEHVTVCFSENFASLSEGMQNALAALGGVPERHRTDRMTLAVHHDGNAEEFTPRYRALMNHYGLAAEATNAYSGNENGDCEQGHRQFKRAVEQALLLRGSRDFASREEYIEFLRGVESARNGGRRQRLAEELAVLRSLPARRLESLVRQRVKVGQGSTIRVHNNVYSVPARLIGEWVEARLGMETIEVWYQDQLLERLPRLRGAEHHRIDYRHIIDWLVRKPGAFAQYRYRADLFPTVRFRRAYDRWCERQPERASREYVRLLHLASTSGAGAVDAVLEQLLAAGRDISVLAVESFLGKDTPLAVAAAVQVAAVDLRQYDELLEWKEAEHGSEGCEDGVDGVSAGAASTGDADAVRGGGPAGGAGDVELPQLLAGVSRA